MIGDEVLREFIVGGMIEIGKRMQKKDVKSERERKMSGRWEKLKTKEGSQPLWMIGDYLVKESLETVGEGRDSWIEKRMRTDKV